MRPKTQVIYDGEIRTLYEVADLCGRHIQNVKEIYYKHKSEFDAGLDCKPAMRRKPTIDEMCESLGGITRGSFDHLRVKYKAQGKDIYRMPPEEVLEDHRRTCPQCDKTFSVIGKPGGSKYCSRPCSLEAYSKGIKDTVDLEKYKDLIIRPGIEKELIPLALYRGCLSLGRIQALWNFVILMFLQEADSFQSGRLLSIGSKDKPHLGGLHVPRTGLNGHTLERFFARLKENPKVAGIIPGLPEYVDYLNPRACRLQRVKRIATGQYVPAVSWRGHRPKKGPRKERDRFNPYDKSYPYLPTTKPTGDLEILHAVHAAVPKGIPRDLRADICQDLVVSVLSGDLRYEELQDHVSEYTRKVFKMFPTKYGPLSLDHPPPWAESGDKRPLHEHLHV